MINKIIHQSWINGDLSPLQMQWTQSIKIHHPDYEYKLWTDIDNENLIKCDYPEFYDFYSSLSKIEKCDFIRPLYIFKYGGVYLDIDIIIEKSLNDILINYPIFLNDATDEGLGGVMLPFYLDNYFFSGKKNESFFYNFCKAMVSEYIYKILSDKEKSFYTTEVMYKTGPLMITKFYLLNKHKYNIKILKSAIISTRLKDKSYQYSHGIHMQNCSWIDEYSKNNNIRKFV